MPTNLDVPPLGESISEAVLLRWVKNDGDTVAAGDPVVELETDKANVEVPSTASGVLRHAKKVGDSVRIGETIARIDESGAGAGGAGAGGKAAGGASESAAPSKGATPPTGTAGTTAQPQDAP